MTYKPSAVVQANINELKKREEVGLSKYGVSLSEANLTHIQLLQHAREEALDFSNYLVQAMRVADIDRENYLELLQVVEYALNLLSNTHYPECNCDVGHENALHKVILRIKDKLTEHQCSRIKRGDMRNDG